MRAGLSTIQQTLTPESSTVVTHSIAEATRRNHGQTTPLHVAATLLSSPSGLLRQACIRSHPNSSHPLQCRALELCFSVALDRLSTAHGSAEPPISNALTAALKRAQAHQRRGCTEQQPLLAVKVEIEQLIVSILDDPSVSRVMREAGFSSPAVKNTIENSFHVLSNRNMYLNPRGEEVKKLLEIMNRRNKRNPVMVGDSEVRLLANEFLMKIEKGEFGNDVFFKNVQVISIDKNQIIYKINELEGMIESKVNSGGLILDLGDLKWVVEQQDMGRAAVIEMGKLVERFRGGDCKVWLIGTATCETYMRCQVYHSTMESDWDLQAVPIVSRSPIPGMFPRLGNERILSNSMESLNQLKATLVAPMPGLTSLSSDNSDPAERTNFCPRCSDNYEKELARLTAIEKSFSESKLEETRPSLPQWLQNAKIDAKTTELSQGNDHYQGLLSKQKTQELRRKWKDTCLNLHPNFNQNTRSNRPAPPLLSTTNLYNPNLLSRPSFQPKLQTMKPLGEALQLNTKEITNTSPRSPVRTDLVLGQKVSDTVPEKDFLSCISSESQTKILDKFSNALDADTYKKLLKGLMENAWWQADAASSLASAITRCRLGNGKRRIESRGDIWLLFTGPDRIGKKKMASVLAEQICGSSPVMISLGGKRDDEANFRGKTAIDRISEGVRRNPFSVIMLEGIDEADMLIRGSIKRAMERGKLTDSNGREIGLGNAVFILTGDWSTSGQEEKNIASSASGNWELGLIVREKGAKRRANWSLHDQERDNKSRKEISSGLSLDLNLDITDGSDRSSDITFDHDNDLGNFNRQFSIASVPHDLVKNVDDSIVFKPVDFSFVRREMKKTISVKFSMILDDEDLSIEVGDDVLEKIMGGIWHDRTSLGQWVDNVLAPSFDRLKPRLVQGDRSGSVVRLVVESESGKRMGDGDWLPSSILV